MEGEEEKSVCGLEDRISHIFSDFLASSAKFEELVAMGHRLLVGFQQGLEFLRRPPINKTSKLVESIIKANDTKRVKSYVQAGCINTHDGVQNISKLHTCQRGLRDHLGQAKCILDGLNCLVENAAAAMQTANEDSSHYPEKENANDLDQQAALHDNMEAFPSCVEKVEVTEYTAMMGVIYCMLKQDYLMQERIISSLNLKSSSRELESYCLMWSLRPFINDEIVHQAWKLIP